MFSVIAWYSVINLLGLITFPLVFKLLPALPDRGYFLARAFGWLLWGFIYWLLGSLGFLKNDLSGLIAAFTIIIAISWWALRSLNWKKVKAWIREHTRYIITTELLFLSAYIAMTIFRAANPEINGTEKPMELAFLNAILRSPTFPPHDPWLSGYAISYYYFGYVLVSMLARLTGTIGSIAFNLSLAVIFALSAIGSYGLLYNLLYKNAHPKVGKNKSRISLGALLAPAFVLIISNLGGLLQLLRIWKVFWKKDASGSWVSPFWSWLDIGSFSQPPSGDPFPHWWWWQASRIIQDFDFNAINKGDIIDEFPFFSFLLGDLHPHVLAMPFAFLALGLTLNLFFGGATGKIPKLNISINPAAFLLSALVLGGLAFLNIWDFPIYTGIFSGAYALRKFYANGDWWSSIKDFFGMGIAIGISGIILYLPFFLSFSSQAGGPLPNLIYITRGVYLWLMFGPLLLPIFVFLSHKWSNLGKRRSRIVGIKQTAGLVLFLLIISTLLSAVIAFLPLLENVRPDAEMISGTFLRSQAAPNWGALLSESFERRLIVPGTLLTLASLLALSLAVLQAQPKNQSAVQNTGPTSENFVILMILAGAILVIIPEFVFLRDMFGYRINTIFKFYFQAWHLWSVAAAYTIYWLWGQSKIILRIPIRIAILIVISIAMIYPIFSIGSKTNNFSPSMWTLDGEYYLSQNSPDDAKAIKWLQRAPLGIVAEAVGGSYSNYARMSTFSGQPTVLGWRFHEVQWRGGSEEIGSREEDIARLYCTSGWDQASDILKQYNVRYIVIGDPERSIYVTDELLCPNGLREAKFMRNLDIAFTQGAVTIYEVR